MNGENSLPYRTETQVLRSIMYNIGEKINSGGRVPGLAPARRVSFEGFNVAKEVETEMLEAMEEKCWRFNELLNSGKAESRPGAEPRSKERKGKKSVGYSKHATYYSYTCT